MKIPSPPKIVKAPEGCELYLTPGKEYRVAGYWSSGYNHYFGYCIKVITDKGSEISAFEMKCPHLKNQDWIVVEREQPEPDSAPQLNQEPNAGI